MPPLDGRTAHGAARHPLFRIVGTARPPAASLAVAGLVLAAGVLGAGPRPGNSLVDPGLHAVAARPSTGLSATTTWRYKTLHGPERVRVVDGGARPVATFTVGARTVTVRGRARTFAEPASTAATVRSNDSVRLLDRPFTGVVDKHWLLAALADTSPDVLAVAAQYETGAPTRRAVNGSLLSSDADYGPLLSDGTRQEGSDFNDYLNRSWAYGGQVDNPESSQIGALDCSGFVRMVLGYRLGVPLTLSPDGVALPRRSFEMLASAPGVVTVPNHGVRPSSTAALAPGDLVFFDASADDGAQVDHVGIYLGVDDAGAPRFISSRKTVNGPTLGDVGGKSVLSGTGLYATAWRAARRI